MSAAELKPCPFCGGVAEECLEFSGPCNAGRGSVFIRCTMPDCQASSALVAIVAWLDHHGALARAASIWNRRAPQGDPA